MSDYDEIRNRHAHGWSIKKICREFGHSRKLVRKVLRTWDGSQPQYKLAKPRAKRVITPEMREFVRAVLVDDKRSPRKQRHSADKIFKRLKTELRVDIGRSTVRGLVREVRQELRNHPPATTPLYFEPGEEMQVDWGAVSLCIAGEQVDANLFVAVLCYSRRSFVQVFPYQNQESFLEAHLRAFEEWDGYAHRWAYDNLKAAVRKVLIGGDREESELFKRFRVHHKADLPRFCTPGIEGAHEKGRVERRVGLARADAFVPLPSFDSWESANAFLREKSREAAAEPHPDNPNQTVADAFEEERTALVSRPRFRFHACKAAEYRADGHARVRYDGSLYSLPCEYGRRRVELRAYHDRVEFYDGTKLIRSCTRSYTRASEDYDYQHYIKLLDRAPGACLNGKPYLGMPDVLLEYRNQLLDGFPRREAARHLAKVLQMVPQLGERVVCDGVELGVASGTLDSAAVAHLVEQLRNAPVPRCQPMDMGSRPELASFKVKPVKAKQYDELQEVCST